MPRFRVDDAAIDYRIAGQTGPLVVQLHGLTSSRARDAEMGLDLVRALRGHRVLKYDARGHGSSTGTREQASYRWDRLAVDLLALLDHVAPGESVHAIGPSMGTGTLLHAAARDPDRFASFTFALPPTAWGTREAQAEGYRASADLIEEHGIEAFIEQGGTAPVPPALADAPITYPEVSEALLPTIMRAAAASDFPDPAAVAAIRIPTLILAWTGDPSHPLRTATRLHELIGGSRLVVARTPYGVMAWPGLFAEHVITAAT
ncbi:alpha/beta hydrolase [Microbacterium saccharophilum]|uniref:Alpha/beta hydrolase n=1 Tax=Microbacterium saccharophilum TaxID=1213358 RepID=A0A5C8I8C8_9MICO|nr:alpha/beta hydrolase [Microbacterium saccharophilum]TXK14950.1 alpha/beta hydrolase [Microbacterium saccharophilum]GEP47347.1 hydrolase [Microbacterium saccharophilum]